jgi:hypothetical protein
MRLLSTKTHGAMDYPSALLLMAAPWVLGFRKNGPETWIPVGIGATMLAQSLMTDYEFGAVRKVPMKRHLQMDGMAGLLLAASPFLLGFAARACLPHVLLGLAEVGAALTTDTHPSDESGHEELSLEEIGRRGMRAMPAPLT